MVSPTFVPILKIHQPIVLSSDLEIEPLHLLSFFPKFHIRLYIALRCRRRPSCLPSRHVNHLQNFADLCRPMYHHLMLVVHSVGCRNPIRQERAIVSWEVNLSVVFVHPLTFHQ